MKKKTLAFNRNKIKLRSLSERTHKMDISDIYSLEKARALSAPISNRVAGEIKSLAEIIRDARENGKPIIAMIGAHVIRRGNSRILIDLMRRGLLTHIATNGAVPIHDAELAMIGATLEDVECYLHDGSFGHWEETGKFINETISTAVKKSGQIGFGEAIGAAILEGSVEMFPHKNISIFAAACKYGIPITVHKGIGQDITDQHPNADYAALGAASGHDFLVFVENISRLDGGGVFLNIGSSVFGPEIYLKALSMARNVARQEGRRIVDFTTAVFDIIPLGDWRENSDIVNYKNPVSLQDPRYYFRPMKSVLIRTIDDGGRSFYIEGDFSVTIPLLYQALTV